MSNHTITQDTTFDKLNFTIRTWLNWLVIQKAIVHLNWRRWPASWLADVFASGVVTVLLVPAWALYRLGALVIATTKQRTLLPGAVEVVASSATTVAYATIPVGDTLVLEIRTEPPTLWIRKNGAAVEVEPGELMALAGALTVAAGGLPELMASRGILWER